MYQNLRAEMARRNINGMMIAEKISIWPATFSAKINGKSEFTLDEAIAIKAALCTDLPLEILFQREED